MSKKELDRLLVVEKCAGKALPQLEGARLLGISVRQLRRLIKGFQAEGASALASKHRASIHQSRERRPCYGELIQIDGSPHDWFEGRADKCTLIVFIDDATGALMQCHFAPSETTEAYMNTL